MVVWRYQFKFKSRLSVLRNISLDDYPVVTKLDLCYLVPYAFLNRVKPYLELV